MRRVKNGIWSVVVLLLVIALWELIVRVSNVEDYVLPPPTSIVDEIIESSPGQLIPAAWVTLQEVLAGFALGTVVGVLLALVVTHSVWVRRALEPLIVASQTVPIIAIAPLFIIWFGFGVTPKILMVSIITFFPVAINTMAGLSAVEHETVSLMRALSASRLQILLKVRIPSALPFFFTGLKQAAVLSVIGAIAGEWVGATEGLGPLMLGAQAAFRTTLVFAAIVYLAAIGIVMFLLVSALERAVIPWYYLTRSSRR